MAKKNKLTGKFIIAFDTICDGWQCATDDNGKPNPTFYDSEDEAMKTLFDDILSMIENQSPKEMRENSGITVKQRTEMKKIEKTGDAKLMKSFLEQNPECNYNDEHIIPAKDFLFGRKAIFGSKGLKIIGIPLD